MPSPFPGMDPYLEDPDLWPEFHGAMLFAFRAALNAVLPPRYGATVDRHVWLHEPDAQSRTLLGRPDVFLTERPGGVGQASATAALPAPAVVILPAERREGPRYLRIVDRQYRRIVTALEILSPSNKAPGPDRDHYLGKRNEYLATQTNLVEIDLLRAGRRPPLGEPAPAPSDYLLFVCRAADFPRAEVWPFGVRDLLPDVPVPLLPEDGTVSFALRPCMDRAYDEARYSSEVDYTQPPVPPLREPDAAWARQLLAATTAARPPGEQS